MSHPMQRQPLHAAQRNSSHSFCPLTPAHSPSLAAAQLVLCTARAIGDDSERANAAFISATCLYEDCHWEFAFERVALLADRGHTPAAKLALLMLRYGAALYGTSFAARPEQIARWAQQVLRQSRAANVRGTNVFVE